MKDGDAKGGAYHATPTTENKKMLLYMNEDRKVDERSALQGKTHMDTLQGGKRERGGGGEGERDKRNTEFTPNRVYR